MAEETYKSYRHALAHLFRPSVVYIITAATYRKLPHLRGDERKNQWRESLDFVIRRERWQLDAWVVLDNHYHLLMSSPETGAERLPRLLGDMHKFLAGRWNKADDALGRQVWYNYWDTCITDERSYYARLNYIHWNPVKHGLAARPEDYPFSSYHDYLGAQEEALRRWEQEYPWERVSVPDDF
jgi:putative transposase